MEPPPPRAPRLTPLRLPHAMASRATSSQDPAGAASGNHNWQPGRRPGMHPARLVDRVAALAGQQHGCPRGPVARPAHSYHGALRRQVPDTSGKPAQRDMPGTGSMPGPPLRGFPHIQQDGARLLQLPGLLRAGLRPAREQAAQPSAHAALAPASPVTGAVVNARTSTSRTMITYIPPWVSM